MAIRVSRRWWTACPPLILFASANLTLVFIPSAVSTFHVCDMPLWFAIGIMVWNSHGNSMDRTSNDILFIWLCILFVHVSLYLTFESKWPQRAKAKERDAFQQYVVRHNRKTDNSNFPLISISVLTWCNSKTFGLFSVFNVLHTVNVDGFTAPNLSECSFAQNIEKL